MVQLLLGNGDAERHVVGGVRPETVILAPLHPAQEDVRPGEPVESPFQVLVVLVLQRDVLVQPFEHEIGRLPDVHHRAFGLLGVAAVKDLPHQIVHRLGREPGVHDIGVIVADAERAQGNCLQVPDRRPHVPVGVLRDVLQCLLRYRDSLVLGYVLQTESSSCWS